MARRVADALDAASWWRGRFDLVNYLESPSTRLDPTIGALPLQTLRRHPDLRAFLARRGLGALHVLAYQAMAEGPYGLVRVAALFPVNPFRGGQPEVFALDGDRRSLHRNAGESGESAHLCLYLPTDPEERRWTVEYGLIGLFDLSRRHLASEHVWRETGRWPTEDAPHGSSAAPTRPRPDLKVPSFHPPLNQKRLGHVL